MIIKQNVTTFLILILAIALMTTVVVKVMPTEEKVEATPIQQEYNQEGIEVVEILYTREVGKVFRFIDVENNVICYIRSASIFCVTP